jgi:drug/metabolite transporter (DMT)-like permease
MLSLIIAVTLFSTVEIASKFIGSRTDPLVITFIRFFLTGIFLIMLSIPVLRLRIEPLGARDYGIFCLNGFLGITIAISIFHTAVQTMDKAASCAVVFSVNPVFVMILARFINGEAWSLRKWLAMALGATGVCFFAFESGILSRSSVNGIGLMLLSAFFFALSICISRRTVARYGAVMLMGFSALFGSLFILPLVWLNITFRELVNLRNVWQPLLYLALPGTTLAYALYYFGFLNVPAQKGSMTFFLKPALASLLATLLLHEKINVYMLSGTTLILLGLAFALTQPEQWPLIQTVKAFRAKTGKTEPSI